MFCCKWRPIHAAAMVLALDLLAHHLQSYKHTVILCNCRLFHSECISIGVVMVKSQTPVIARVQIQLHLLNVHPGDHVDVSSFH